MNRLKPYLAHLVLMSLLWGCQGKSKSAINAQVQYNNPVEQSPLSKETEVFEESASKILILSFDIEAEKEKLRQIILASAWQRKIFLNINLAQRDSVEFGLQLLLDFAACSGSIASKSSVANFQLPGYSQLFFSLGSGSLSSKKLNIENKEEIK